MSTEILKQRAKVSLDEQTAAAYDGIDVPIRHYGSAITLPEQPMPMNYTIAIETLKRKQAEEQQVVAISEPVDAFPYDGAVAFQKAMQRMFGWVSAVPTPGWFGDTPPQTKEVKIGPRETMNVVWSRFEIPGIAGWISCDSVSTPKGPRFQISGSITRKDHETIRALAKLTREIAEKESIYRGKAIKMTVGADGRMAWDDGISFLDLSTTSREELVFSEATERQISTSLWTPIRNTELCRKHKIPLKRGILLEGKYGTGKTMTSSATAMLAVENGWTFLTINRVSGLEDALNFARKFQPCVLFAEDIDRAMKGSDRTTEIDDILNTIDGIESKNTEIFVVLTTNHIEKINKAMLRPGRLDAIVSVTAPDKQAVKRLILQYGRTMLDENATFDQSAEKLAGQIPAMIREAVERSKLYAIDRMTSKDDVLQITDADLYAAALGMEDHQRHLSDPIVEDKEPTMSAIMERAFMGGLNRLVTAASETSNEVREARGEIRTLDRTTREAMGVQQSSRQFDPVIQLIRQLANA